MNLWQRLSARTLAHTLGYAATLGVGIVVGVTQLWDLSYQITGGDWLQFLGMILLPIVYYLIVQRRDEKERDRREQREKEHQIIRSLLDDELKPGKVHVLELYEYISRPQADNVHGGSLESNKHNRAYALEVYRKVYMAFSHLLVSRQLFLGYKLDDAAEHAFAIMDNLDTIRKVAGTTIETPHGENVNIVPIIEMAQRKYADLINFAAISRSVQLSKPNTEIASDYFSNELLKVKQQNQQGSNAQNEPTEDPT